MTVTLTVSKDNPTKALTEDEDNNKIKTSFGADENIYVFQGNTCVGTLNNGTGGDTFTGDLTGVTDGTVNLYYLQKEFESNHVFYLADFTIDYSTGQKGTLADIAKNYDLAIGTATYSNGGFGTGAVTLEAQQAILKVTLSDVSETEEESKAKTFTELTISTANGTDIPAKTYTATRTASSEPFYIAIPASASANYTFLATTSDATPKQYWGYKASAPEFKNGNAYKTTVNLEKFDVAENVDLGTAGTWANMNYNDGSALSKVTDYGKYYTYTEASEMTGCPSQEDFRKLAALDKGWYSLNGFNGQVFGTDDNPEAGTKGRHIFLPAVGYYDDDDDLFRVSSNGDYWSSTPYDEDEENAYNLDFDSSCVNPEDNNDCTYRLSVRLLRIY